MRMVIVLPVLCLAISLGGCITEDVVAQLQTSISDGGSRIAATVAAVTPTNLADPSAMPWQLTPASAASAAQGEMTLVIDRLGYGHIRGTRRALAQLDQAIIPFSKGGRVVAACNDVLGSQARAAGAYSVEAAASGPERPTSSGRTQRVFFRIFYPDRQDNGVEVRQSAIDCTINRNGRLVRVRPV